MSFLSRLTILPLIALMACSETAEPVVDAAMTDSFLPGDAPLVLDAGQDLAVLDAPPTDANVPDLTTADLGVDAVLADTGADAGTASSEVERLCDGELVREMCHGSVDLEEFRPRCRRDLECASTLLRQDAVEPLTTCLEALPCEQPDSECTMSSALDLTLSGVARSYTMLCETRLVECDSDGSRFSPQFCEFELFRDPVLNGFIACLEGECSTINACLAMRLMCL